MIVATVMMDSVIFIVYTISYTLKQQTKYCFSQKYVDGYIFSLLLNLSLGNFIDHFRKRLRSHQDVFYALFCFIPSAIGFIFDLGNKDYFDHFFADAGINKQG